jgi:hypothetical protein
LLVDIPADDGGAESRVLQCQLSANSLTGSSYEHDIAIHAPLLCGNCLVKPLENGNPKLDDQHKNLKDEKESVEDGAQNVVRSMKSWELAKCNLIDSQKKITYGSAIIPKRARSQLKLK